MFHRLDYQDAYDEKILSCNRKQHVKVIFGR